MPASQTTLIDTSNCLTGKDHMNFISRLLFILLLIVASPVLHAANPYLAKPGDAPTSIRVATCAISGGFMHLYTAVDNRLFEKYGFKVEFLLVRGAGVSMAALASNELQFLYC